MPLGQRTRDVLIGGSIRVGGMRRDIRDEVATMKASESGTRRAGPAIIHDRL
jgi:hypothetical protein